MARANYADFISIPTQLQVQRYNLISVCRLVVKSLTDTANVMSIDETSTDLQNLFATLEQIFSHRIKPNITWYGGPEQRFLWDFMKVACRSVPRNCLGTVEAMNLPKTSLGKGRAWMRMCLMEKRLSDYIRTALQSFQILETFYEEGSIMMSEEISILPDILLGLNIIDFSFDIKGTYLDFPWVLAVNYSKYLKFNPHSNEVIHSSKSGQEPSLVGLAEPRAHEYGNESDEQKVDSKKLMEQLRVTTEQKRYLDELLRLRELQIEDLSSERKKVCEDIEAEKLERNREKAQFESIIFELQSQLFHLREQTKGLARKLQEKSRSESETSQPGVLMSHLLTREVEEESATTNQEQDMGISLAEELRESFETQANENKGFHCEDNKELITAGVNDKQMEGSHFEDFVKA